MNFGISIILKKNQLKMSLNFWSQLSLQDQAIVMKKNHFIYVMVASIMLLIAACSDENQLSENILSDEIISLTTGQKEQILAYAKEVIIPNVESKRELAETRGTTVTTPENETAAWGLRRRFIYPLLNCY